MISWQTCDVFDGLATLEDGSIDLVVTSPPFLALRSYLPADHPDKGKEIGSEATPAEFLDVMLQVTAELRRVLAPHGSIAIELGDTYAGSTGGGGDYQLRDVDGRQTRRESFVANGVEPNTNLRIGDGWPLAKSRTLIPELFRIALAYGFNPLTGQESPAGKWRVRNVVTWCRPNPPVGALGDKWRPATSDIVVACVSGRRFWDDLATRKPSNYHRESLYTNKATPPGQRPNMSQHTTNPSGAPLLDYWEIPLLDGEEKPYGPKEKPKPPIRHVGGKAAGSHLQPMERGDIRPAEHEAGAPLLDYWEIPPTGYAGAHYATFPSSLVEPLVKAMVPQRVCRTCGEPSRRIVESARIGKDGRVIEGDFMPGDRVNGINHKDAVVKDFSHNERVDLGFTDCGHDNFRPGRVLDPFAGSGTTLAVASGHGHDAIGFDLDPRNEDLARERVGPLLWQEA